MALSFNVLVTQHLQIRLLCMVNFQVYESHLPRMKTRKLRSLACSAGRGRRGGCVTPFHTVRLSKGHSDLEVSVVRERAAALSSGERAGGGRLRGHQ